MSCDMVIVLKSLIYASERAASIARSCMTNSKQDTLLIAEKGEGEANTRFDKDFKTIADVLAQECAKYEISSRIPNLKYAVRGEECAEINGVVVKRYENERDTEEMLCQLIPPSTAKFMSNAAHTNLNTEKFEPLPSRLPDLDINDIGIWIDPIDATAEFIAGVQGKVDADRGLPCVTVLIGAYLKSSGEPIVGVINQPFYNNLFRLISEMTGPILTGLLLAEKECRPKLLFHADEVTGNRTEGRVVWGVCYNNVQLWGGVKEIYPNKNTILMSAAEKSETIDKLENNDWNIKTLPGAGNKLMKVVLGEAAGYIVSQGTTFRWDTCGPQAILRAKGGNIICYTDHTPIIYNDPENCDTQEYCNKGGIIAYKNSEILNRIMGTDL